MRRRDRAAPEGWFFVCVKRTCRKSTPSSGHFADLRTEVVHTNRIEDARVQDHIRVVKQAGVDHPMILSAANQTAFDMEDHQWSSS